MKRLLLAAGCLAATAVHAMSGNELLQMMNSPYTNEQASAMFYVMGTVEGHGAISGVVNLSPKTGGSTTGMFCIPAGATNGQIRDVVKQHLAAHPETRHLPAASLSYLALMRTWACP